MCKLKAQIYILSLALLWGCSQGTVEKPADVSVGPAPLGQGEAVRQIGQAEVSCAGTGNCNESTGMLLIAGEDGPHGCTASLIAPDTLVTNSHCIPGSLRTAGADCSNQIWVKFPAMQDLPAETEECSSIVKATTFVDGATNQIDYAFLKLKSAAHRIPLTINYGGMNDQESLSIYKFDFSLKGNQITGVMGHQSCLGIQDSMILPQFNRAEAPLVTLSGCDLADGNAGAPLLDGKGQIRGIIQSRAVSTLEPSFLKTYLLDDSYESVELASNFACMTSREVLSGHVAGSACDEGSQSPGTAASSPSSLEMLLHPELENLKRNFDAKIDKSSLPVHVQWGAGDVPSTSSVLAADEQNWGSSGALGVSPVPVCIANLRSWIQSYSNGALGMKRSADEAFTLPVSLFRLGLNSNEVPDYRQADTTQVSASLHFDPQEVFHKNAGTFEIHIQKQVAPNAGADEILFKGLLKECSVGPSP